jgi:predicted DNA binding protein
VRLASLNVNKHNNRAGCLPSGCDLSVKTFHCIPKNGSSAAERQTCAAFRLTAGSGCILDSVSKNENGTMQWSVIAPNLAALRNLVSNAEELGCTVQVKKISVIRTASELTAAQERVMQMAFDLGYFDVPKRITLDKLARRLEIPKATLDVMLKRAQRKLVASHVGGTS